MFDFLKKRLEQLADSLIDPVWQRLLKWSWFARAFVLLLAATVAYFVAHPDSAESVWKLTSAAFRVAVAGNEKIPISDELNKKLQGLTARISSTLTADLELPDKPDVTAWSTAQTALATHQVGRALDEARITSFFRTTEDARCGCWREVPSKPRNVFISGWVLLAMAQLHRSATIQEIEFLLKEQRQDGAWSVFLVDASSPYESSYATAWAIIGLKGQLDLGIKDTKLQRAVSASVRKGSAWLEQHHEAASRWKDYPVVKDGQVSESISGVVLHALHTAASDDLSQLDSDWLDQLPSAAIRVTDAEHPYVYYRTLDGYVNDDFVQVKMPWVLVATVDAYHNGTLIQRARTLFWLESLLDKKDVMTAEVQSDNWWRSELLFALGYLRTKTL